MRREHGSFASVRYDVVVVLDAAIVLLALTLALGVGIGCLGPGGVERWPAFTRFLEDGRVCLTNNAAERSLRGVALGRKSWLFAGSERGGHRAAFVYTLIVTAKMNDIDPQAWLADVLARLPDMTASQVPDLLPWNWQPPELRQSA